MQTLSCCFNSQSCISTTSHLADDGIRFRHVFSTSVLFAQKSPFYWNTANGRDIFFQDGSASAAILYVVNTTPTIAASPVSGSHRIFLQLSASSFLQLVKSPVVDTSLRLEMFEDSINTSNQITIAMTAVIHHVMPHHQGVDLFVTQQRSQAHSRYNAQSKVSHSKAYATNYTGGQLHI